MKIDKKELLDTVSSMLEYQKTSIWYLQVHDYVKVCTTPIDMLADATIAEYVLNHVPGLEGIEPVHTLEVQVKMIHEVGFSQQGK